MKNFEVNGSLRTEKGKKFTKKIRKQEQIPAIIYGGKENVLITVNERDLRDLIYTPYVYLVNINIDGKTYKTVVKDIQFHPVSDKILHIDFLEISDEKRVTIGIPIELTGSSEGVKQGGKLQLVTRKLQVSAFPKDLPDNLQVDITDLNIGKTKLVSDLNFEKLHIIDPKSTVIASVKLTRAARGEATEEAEAGATATAAAAAPAEAKEAKKE